MTATFSIICFLTSLLNQLDGESDAVAASETERRHTAAAAAIFQRIDECRENTRAARANRMAEGDGPPMNIRLRSIEIELFRDRASLHRESFVELDEIDIVVAPASLVEKLLSAA